MKRICRVFFGLSSIFIFSSALAESDYQLTEAQLDDEEVDTTANSYDVKDIGAFKEKALEHSNVFSDLKNPGDIAQPKSQNVGLELKIQNVLNAFKDKIDLQLRADLEKALRASLIENRESKPEVIKEKIKEKEVASEKPDVAVKKTAEHGIADQETVATKASQDRISEINKALSDPKLDWSDFERLMEERKTLEQAVKAAPSVASGGTQQNNQN